MLRNTKNHDGLIKSMCALAVSTLSQIPNTEPALRVGAGLNAADASHGLHVYILVASSIP